MASNEVMTKARTAIESIEGNEKGESHQTKLADQTKRALPIFTPMTMPHEKALLITTPEPIIINGPAIIYSNWPVIIHAGAEKCAEIQPCCPLGPAFASGWSKLADELKLRILSFNLTFDVPITHETAADKSRLHRKELQLHACMTPEIAALATEIFYTTNVFHLEVLERDHEDDPGLFLPPPAFKHMIRRLEFKIKLDGHGWRHLLCLASGAYGFEQLQFLKVMVDLEEIYYDAGGMGLYCTEWSAYIDDDEARKVIDVVEQEVNFPWAGELELLEARYAWNYAWNNDIDEEVDEHVQNRLRDMVKERMSFATN